MKRTFRRGAVLLTVLAVIPLLSMCRRSSDDSTFDDYGEYADTLTHHARLLTIADIGHGTVRVDIGSPDSDKPTARLALVHRDSVIPDSLPADIRVIRTPVSRAAVFSAVHTGALDELGALDALSAIADGNYLGSTDTVAALVASGRVIDAGPSQSPSAERLVAGRPEVILSSPYEGMTMPRLPESMTVVPCTDYLENTPIARAEWILLFGELFGSREKARAIFTDVIDQYSDLCFKAAGASSPKPKVLTESETSGVWYVPAGHSYMARMLADAGADYPWAYTDGTGSLALNLETVAEKAIDADIWLLRTYGYKATPECLKKQNPRYAAFKPVREGTVYGCDTSVSPVFNDIAFHPERVLADYVAIFHPDVMPEYTLRYFSR